jgi:hypothetical protein
MNPMIKCAAKAMARVLSDNGMHVFSPDEGDQDDVERERWLAVVESVRAAFASARNLSTEQMQAAWPHFRPMDYGQGEYCWQRVIDEALK